MALRKTQLIVVDVVRKKIKLGKYKKNSKVKGCPPKIIYIKQNIKNRVE